MNRRNFLRTLLGGAAMAAAAPVLDLEKLLWVPGARTFFLPPGPTVQTFRVGDIFTIAGVFNNNPKTIQFRKPQRFVITADIGGSYGMVIHPTVQRSAEFKKVFGDLPPFRG